MTARKGESSTRMTTRTLRAAILAGCASIAMATVAVAQEEPAVEIDIEAQSLSSALTTLGRQIGAEIAFTPDSVRALDAPEVKGVMTPEDALERLLAGSGLDHRRTASNVVMIAAPRPNAAERRFAQADVVDEPRPAMGPIDDDAAPVHVFGGVQDDRTGANLKGALVEIEETGQTTSTDDLGNFRFAAVRPGRYTLRISYLGYRDIQTTIEVTSGRQFDRTFVMTSGGQVDTIVVYGQRSARAQALNQERTADNFTTVLSSDLLGSFVGTTISDALRRTPGVAFEPDPLTGEGANIIIRGLDPDLNQVTLNGLRLGEGSGAGRSPDLSGILTESIESVTINKTLLASQDSNGAGGLVEIETKSPLDRARRFASFGVEHGFKGDDFGDDTLISGTLSGIFGADDSFGASVSVQYREQENVSHSYDAALVNNGLILPEGARARSSVDPRTPFPFVAGFDELPIEDVIATSTESNSESFTITGSLQKQFGSHTDIRLDIVHSEVESSQFNSTTRFGSSGNYVLLPVPELGGEVRAVWVAEDSSEFSPGIPFSGQRTIEYTPDAKSASTTFGLQGTTVIDEWTFNYQGGFAGAETETPLTARLNVRSDPNVFVGGPFSFSIDPALLNDEVLGRTIGGRVLSAFPLRKPGDQSFVFPGFSEAGQAIYSSSEGSLIESGEVGRNLSGENNRYSASGSARREFSNIDWLNYVEAGFSYEEADFGSIPSALNAVSYSPEFDFDTFQPDRVPLTGFGLSFIESPLVALGVAGAPVIIDPGSIAGFETSLDRLADEGALERFTFDESLTESLKGNNEKEYSYYFQSRLDIGKLEIIGGVRISQVDVNTEFFISSFVIGEDGLEDIEASQEASQRVSGSVSQTDVLPRILVNYRLTDNMTFRGGYFSTFGRPQVENLVTFGGAFLNLEPTNGPRGDQPVLFINQGNPNLEPSFTQNYDVSWEWYTDSLGVLKASAFYKTTENFLQRNSTQGSIDIIPEGVTLPDTDAFNNLPDDIFVDVIQTFNSDTTSDIWGMEFSIERQFTFLPGLWRNFGVYANYAYVDSSQDVLFLFNDPDDDFALKEVVFADQPFDGSPKHSGTAAITYSSQRLDANLTYTAQARRRGGIGAHGLSSYDDEVRTLDFRSQYSFDVRGANVRLYFEGRDLLRSPDEAFLGTTFGGADGVPKYFTGGSFLGGREFRIGLSSSF